MNYVFTFENFTSLMAL